MSITISDAFPIVSRCIWLNHAAISPWPGAVIRAMQGFIDDNRENGPLNYARWLKIEQRVRTRAAALLNGDADDIALVQNTSAALNHVARGIDWRAGDAVVFPAGEFPSNALPWRELAAVGVEVREIALDADDPEAPLLDALDERVRLLAFSSVRYDTGLRLDIERLGRAAHDCGALVCVDAIQHLGACTLDVASAPVDFVAAGSHKWLLAPEGLALFWSHPAARDQLQSTTTGWRIWEDMFSFSDEHETLPGNARRFEPGTLNNAGIHGLDAALGVLLDAGPDSVAERIAGHAATILASLKALPGIECATPEDPAHRAGIVTFRVPHPDRVFHALQSEGIHVAQRGGGLRLSPHFYTPEAHIERTLSILEDALE